MENRPCHSNKSANLIIFAYSYKYTLLRMSEAKRGTSIPPKTVDVEQILQNKLGKRARYVPRFVVRWLQRTLHETRVNAFLYESRHLTGVAWLEACVAYLQMELVVHGREHLPSDADGQRYTFVSNHPLGGGDGVALGALLGKHYDGRVKYLVNDVLMHLPGLAPLCIPINKTGKQSKDFPAMVEAGFASDAHMILFPAGLCSRKRGGSIADLPWRKTFITKSIQTQRDVVPIHFGGHNSARFYNIERVCHALGLKANIAMLFLVDEMYRNVGKRFDIHIGKPIPWHTFDKSKTAAEWAAYVRDIVYQLPRTATDATRTT